MDPVALEALAAGPSGSGGPGRAPTAEHGAEDDEDEAVAAPRLKKNKMGEAIVPAEQTEEALRAEARAERWFGQDIFQGLTPSSGSRALAPADDGGSEASDHGSDAEDFAVVASQMRELSDNQLPNMPLTDKQKRQLKRKRDAERKGKSKEEEEDNRPMEIAPLEAPKPLVPVKNQKPSDPQELAETMALGSLMVDSKKSRMDLIDAAYNRWTFDADSGLPDWFTEDENKHNKPELPISKALMDQFRAKLREINARPIRKVTEAKNRKRRRLQKRLEKLRSTAMSLADVGDMSEIAKARQMRKAISKAARADERKVQVVAIKKGGGGHSQTKGKVPKGAKVKVVDRRLKSDRRGEKKAAAFNKRRQKTLNKKQNRKKQAIGGSGGNRESGGRGVYNRGSA
jgi:AdoMet-dependent rRNA methyltransferase SPB1